MDIIIKVLDFISRHFDMDLLIRTLHLGLNFIDRLDDSSLSPLTDLRHFSLVGCHPSVPLSIDADAFAANVVLEAVNVTKCPGLEEIPPRTFSNLPYLRLLNLEGNGLAFVSPAAADWSAIEHFDLTGNPYR